MTSFVEELKENSEVFRRLEDKGALSREEREVLIGLGVLRGDKNGR